MTSQSAFPAQRKNVTHEKEFESTTYVLPKRVSGTRKTGSQGVTARKNKLTPWLLNPDESIIFVSSRSVVIL